MTAGLTVLQRCMRLKKERWLSTAQTAAVVTEMHAAIHQALVEERERLMGDACMECNVRFGAHHSADHAFVGERPRPSLEELVQRHAQQHLTS